jgi:RecA-family ATPase
MPSEMIFILGAPGTGKTLFAFEMIHKIAMPTLYISSDSASFMLFQRALQAKLHLTKEELLELKIGSKEPISHFINYITFKDSRIDAKSIESFAEQMPTHPKLIVVDPMTSFDGVGKNEKEVLDSAMDDIRILANEKGYIFIMVSHLNRTDSRNNDINMFSGYMSSRIEKNADKMIGLKRNIGTMEKEGSNLIKVGHVKNRFGANLKLHNFRVDFPRQKVEFVNESF